MKTPYWILLAFVIPSAPLLLAQACPPPMYPPPGEGAAIPFPADPYLDAPSPDTPPLPQEPRPGPCDPCLPDPSAPSPSESEPGIPGPDGPPGPGYPIPGSYPQEPDPGQPPPVADPLSSGPTAEELAAREWPFIRKEEITRALAQILLHGTAPATSPGDPSPCGEGAAADACTTEAPGGNGESPPAPAGETPQVKAEFSWNWYCDDLAGTVLPMEPGDPRGFLGTEEALVRYSLGQISERAKDDVAYALKEAIRHGKSLEESLREIRQRQCAGEDRVRRTEWGVGPALHLEGLDPRLGLEVSYRSASCAISAEFGGFNPLSPGQGEERFGLGVTLDRRWFLKGVCRNLPTGTERRWEGCLQVFGTIGTW